MIINQQGYGSGGGEKEYSPMTWINYSVTFANGSYQTQTNRITSLPLMGVTKISLSNTTDYEMACCAWRLTNTSNNINYIGWWHSADNNFSTTGTDYFSSNSIDISNYWTNTSYNWNRIIVRVVVRHKADPTTAIDISEGDVCTIKVLNFNG